MSDVSVLFTCVTTNDAVQSGFVLLKVCPGVSSVERAVYLAVDTVERDTGVGTGSGRHFNFGRRVSQRQGCPPVQGVED